MLIFITVYARAAEGEAVPAMVAAGRVDIRCEETKDVYITKIRRISPRRPSVTTGTRVPQATDIDTDIPAANAQRSEKDKKFFSILRADAVRNTKT